MDVYDLEVIAREHLLANKKNMATWSSLPGKIVLNLWYEWDCGCNGNYHSSCSSPRFIKSYMCDKPRIKVKAKRQVIQ